MIEKSRDMRGEIKILGIESLMPQNHLLRKIDKVIDFDEEYTYFKESNSISIVEGFAIIKYQQYSTKEQGFRRFSSVTLFFCECIEISCS